MRGKTLEQLVAEAQAQIGHTAAETLKTAIDNNEPVIILDVRDKEQYDAEHLPVPSHCPAQPLSWKSMSSSQSGYAHYRALWRQHPWFAIRTHLTNYGIRERLRIDGRIPRLESGGSTD